MLVFGHLGIGSGLVLGIHRRLSLPWVVLGASLPDVLDKSLYFLFRSILSGGRLFGHTLLFGLLLLFISRLKKSHALLAIAGGMLSHQFLDWLMDFALVISGIFPPGAPESDGALALFWPLLGWKFPVNPHASVGAQLSAHLNIFEMGAEVIGLGILIGFYVKGYCRVFKQ